MNKEENKFTEKPVLEDEPGYVKHKYLREIGREDYLGFGDSKTTDKAEIKRWHKFKEAELKTGVFPSDSWDLDHVMMKYLYEHLIDYKKIAARVVDLSYHKFTYKDKEYTQVELIDKLLDLCLYILATPEDMNKRSVIYKKYKNNPYYLERKREYESFTDFEELDHEVWNIWAIVFPSMWW